MKARHASVVILLLAMLPAASMAAPTRATAEPCARLRLNEFLPQPAEIDWNHDCQLSIADQWVELYNPDDAPCDAGGWQLARGRPGTAPAYTIPAGTILGAHGYAVLYAGPFSLHPTNGELWLWQPGGTPQWCQYFSSAPDRSINRLDSDLPAWELYLDTPPSPGQANGSVAAFPEPGLCTPTPGPATDTPASSPTPTESPTPTDTPSPAATPSRTRTATRTATPTRTATATRTSSPTRTATATRTSSPTRTATHTRTATPTRTSTPTAVASLALPTPIASATPKASSAPPATEPACELGEQDAMPSPAALASTPPTATIAPSPSATPTSPAAAGPASQAPALPPLLWLVGLIAFFGWMLVRRPAKRR